ncbi:MAG: NAD-dependent epimerase/dehydratase family protein [Ignavibacteria bacterium]
MTKILITGTAGFIGFHLVKRLSLDESFEIVGIDNINSYYDIRLKYARLKECGINAEEIEYQKPLVSSKYKNYTFIKLDLTDKQRVSQLFAEGKFDYVIHLAAQAGVRYSLVNPHSYIDNNIIGFLNILEGCRHHFIKHLLYASSSSVYGTLTKKPFSEGDLTDKPISLYAATKKANESMAYTYNHLFGLKSVGLRFFTVYGPWGRPDMALFIFTRKILQGKPVEVYNFGKMWRDFTYIDDVIEGIARILNLMMNSWGNLKDTEIINIGNNHPTALLELIENIELLLNKKAEKKLLPVPPGDVIETFADISKLESLTGWKPETHIKTGVSKFLDWYQNTALNLLGE